MRIVTYARVSTKSQSDRGTSLHDQETRFTEWLERSGHTRVRAYAEAMSGGKNMQERTFQGMLEDLPHLDAEALVVDSLDRFTRDKIAGAAMTHRLREMGVKLWELEYSDTEPFDLSIDEHRDYIVQRFNDAEGERRRIKKRQLKRFQEQRQRGATTTNRPAFGLRLAGDRKGHRYLEPDPDTAPIVSEVDTRILSGATMQSVVDWLRDIPGSWRSKRGLSLMLKDKHGAYVKAGVRSIETQQKLRELLATRKQTYGPDRTTRSAHEHALSGLVNCKYCVDAGYKNAPMVGHYIKQNPNPYSLMCSGVRDGVVVHKRMFYAASHLVLNLVMEKMERLRDVRVAEAVLQNWAKEPREDKSAKLRQSLERQLSQCDEREAALEKRVAFAFDMAAEGGPGAAEAKRLIAKAESERMALEAQRAAITQKLSQLPVTRATAYTARDLQWDASQWPNFRMGAEGLIEADIREPFAKWVRAIGPPELERYKPPKKGKARLKLHWRFLDNVKKSQPDHAPEVPEVDLTSVA